MPDKARYEKDKAYYYRYNNSPERRGFLVIYWKQWQERNKMWDKPAREARAREAALRKRAERVAKAGGVPLPAETHPLTEEEARGLQAQIYGLARTLRKEEENPGAVRKRRKERLARLGSGGKDGK